MFANRTLEKIMKVYVINLDRRPDRLAEITAQLGNLNLMFERVSAVDAHNAPLSDLVDWWKARIYCNFENPHSGQIGAYTSHRIAWQMLLDSGDNAALVFEDDAIATDWDPAILEVQIEAWGLDQLRLEKLDRPVWAPYPMDGRRIDMVGRTAINVPSYGAAAYIITAEGARKALAVGKFWFNIDHFDMWERVGGLRTAILIPPPFKQSRSQSDISQTPKATKILTRFGRRFMKFLRDFRTTLLWPVLTPAKYWIVKNFSGK
jgi:GR25 family glycosyltransferase involved in LPS biosynthesis